MSDYLNTTRTFLAADHAWTAELERLYGGEAGTMRYHPKGEGEPGSHLRQLYNAFRTTREVWLAAWRNQATEG